MKHSSRQVKPFQSDPDLSVNCIMTLAIGVYSRKENIEINVLRTLRIYQRTVICLLLSPCHFSTFNKSTTSDKISRFSFIAGFFDQRPQLLSTVSILLCQILLKLYALVPKKLAALSCFPNCISEPSGSEANDCCTGPRLINALGTQSVSDYL